MNPFEFPEKISRYAEEHTTDEDAVLYELYRTTYLKVVHPQMLSGKVQGRFLAFISEMLRPRRILEIGTFTGYSAYCLAKGLPDDGKLVTIEVNEELEEMVRAFLKKSGLESKIDLVIGNALEIIPRLEDSFDLIFIDADKEQYCEYYELGMQVLNHGGYIIADNVLWGGKVAELPPGDESSLTLHKFNTLVQEDKRVENVFLTIRDGLMVIKKM
ncbi:MAG: O-methyltransferase [Bacteroidales bacterium]